MMPMFLSMAILLSASTATADQICDDQLADAETTLVKCVNAVNVLYGQAMELDTALRATLDQNAQLAQQLEEEQNPPIYMRKEVWAVLGLVLGVAAAK